MNSKPLHIVSGTEAARLDERSLELRRAIVAMLGAAGRGHLAPALSLVEILRVLYDHVMRFNPADPGWKERDRFILSKGHGCMALYVILAEKGFFPADELARFCRAEGILGGHPEWGKIPGVEASTGSLGHGLSIGVGMALAGRMDQSSRRVFVVIGDGESNEGSIWEAALCAGKHGLENLCVLVDCNQMQSWGPTAEIQNLEPLADKWRAFGFGVGEIDGHDVEALKSRLSQLPFSPGKPSVLICRTIKGKGIKGVENNLSWHHKSRVGPEMVRELLDNLGGD